MADCSVDLLRLIRGDSAANGGWDNNSGYGVRIIQAVTEAPVTFVFEGTQLALDTAVFEIPSQLQPIKRGSRYFVLPIVGGNTQRRAVLAGL